MKEARGKMEKRRLGRTGLEVSVLGFGGAPIGEHLPPMTREEAERIVRYAFDQGINYFDTARSYYNSEERIGDALAPVRDDCVIATKVEDMTRGGAWVQLRHSLKRLRTTRIDAVQLHGVNDLSTLKRAMGSDSALEALREARSQGLVDHIGITGHYPHVLIEAIRTGEFDAIQVPINVITRRALEELVPLAKELDVGVVVMKPFGGQPFFLGSDEFRTLLGRDDREIARRALGFLLRREVSTIVSGFENVEEIDAAVKAVRDFDRATHEEEFEFWSEEGGLHCREGGTLNTCEMCMPCPEFVKIPAILRFDRYYGYGLKDWARSQYMRLSTRVDDCTQCGECEKRCPYDLPIVKLLQQADQRLSLPKV